MAQEGEPSVEEILDSIKKVIARDNKAGAAEQRRVRQSRGIEPAQADPEPEEDVLELGEAGEFVEDEQFDAVSFEDHFDAMPDETLVGAEARDSMRESLAALAMLAEPPAAPQIVRSGETSLEGLTRDLLRPALAEWLDRNLPPLVEELVAAEIARIVGKKS